MARIRSIHPGLWTDEAFVSVSTMARLLHIGIWNECDDIGCFEWKPLTLRMRLFPADNADVPALLAELIAANMIMRYSVNGKDFGAVRNFCKYQRPKAPKSVHPNTPEVLIFVGSSADISEINDDDGGSGSETKKANITKFPKKSETEEVEQTSFPKKAEIAPQMEEGGDNREEEEEEEYLPLVDISLKRNQIETDFDEFWQRYPRRVGKDAARRSFAKARDRATQAEILSAIDRQRWNPDPAFVPHPATWLNQGRWQDDPDAAAPMPQPPVVKAPIRESRGEQMRREYGLRFSENNDQLRLQCH